MTSQRVDSLSYTLAAFAFVATAAWGAEHGMESRAGSAAKPTVVTIPLAAGHDTIGLSVTPGGKPFTQIVLEFADGSKKVLTLNVRPQTARRRVPLPADAPQGAKPAYEEVQAEDSLVAVSGMNLRIFAQAQSVSLHRPAAGRSAQALGQPSGRVPNVHALRVPQRGRPRGDVDQRLLCGRVSRCGRFAAGPGVVACRSGDQGRGVVPTAGGRGTILCVGHPPDCQAGRLREARVLWPAGADREPAESKTLHRVEGVPLLVADGSGNGDVGVVRQMKGSWALECDEHLSRTPFDGMPETLHFSVPPAFYHKAYVLCTAEPDPRKDPVLTVRMTRFARSGRGEAMSHTSVVLPRGDEAPAGNLKRVGTVAYTVDGQSVETPLYLAELDLDVGAILDLLGPHADRDYPMLDGRYLDIDLLGKIERVKPVRDSISAVHVFGITLERCPAEFSLVQRQPGNIFYNDEVPETVAVVKASEPCQTTLSWQITDVSGALVREDRVHLDFAAAGQERQHVIDLQAPRPGWYGLKFATCGAPQLRE